MKKFKSVEIISWPVSGDDIRRMFPLLFGERVGVENMSEKITVRIKPLSVNVAWRGRRFKTDAYKSYELAVFTMLTRNIEIPETGKLEILLEFGLSNRGSDWDNPIKPFVDILQKKYKFDDNRIYKATVIKTIVKKGDEFIKFELK